MLLFLRVILCSERDSGVKTSPINLVRPYKVVHNLCFKVCQNMRFNVVQCMYTTCKNVDVGLYVRG